MIVLTRTRATKDGTFGRMVIPINAFGSYDAEEPVHRGELVTMEDDWLGNRKGVSCIPEGTYPLRRTIFYKHGYEVFEVTGVRGRDRILIHIANTEEDVEGCIGPGLFFGPLRVRDEDDPAHPWVYKEAALSSGVAFRRFMDWMAHVEEAPLRVVWAPGVKPPDTGVLVA